MLLRFKVQSPGRMSTGGRGGSVPPSRTVLRRTDGERFDAIFHSHRQDDWAV